MASKASGLVVLVYLCLLADCASDRGRFATAADVLDCARGAIWGQLDQTGVSSVSVTIDATDATGQSKFPTDLTFGWPGPTFRRRMVLNPASPNPAVSITTCQDGQCDEGLEHQPSQFTSAVSRGRMKGFATLAIELFMRDDVLPGLTWAEIPQVEGPRVLLDATDQSDFNLRVAVDKGTCLPASTSSERSANLGDGFSARGGDRHVETTELLDYQLFDGLRLPTRLRLLVDGAPNGEWHVTQVHVVARQGK